MKSLVLAVFAVVVMALAYEALSSVPKLAEAWDVPATVLGVRG